MISCVKTLNTFPDVVIFYRYIVPKRLLVENVDCITRLVTRGYCGTIALHAQRCLCLGGYLMVTMHSMPVRDHNFPGSRIHNYNDIIKWKHLRVTGPLSGEPPVTSDAEL